MKLSHVGLHCRIPLCRMARWQDEKDRDSCGGGVRAIGRIVLRVPFALVVGVIGLVLSGAGPDAPALLSVESTAPHLLVW